MNIIRIITILTCGALNSLAAAPEDFESKAVKTVIPKLELQNTSPAEAFKVITKATGIPISYNPGKAEQATINLSLTSIPASEAVLYVTSLAGLKFSYEKDGIRVVQNAAPGAAIPKTAVTAKAPAPAASIPEYVVQPAPGAAARPPSADSVTGEFKINTATFVRTLRQATPPRQGETDDLLLARFLKERHIEIRALTLNGPNGRVLMRASDADMQKARTFVEQLDSGTLPPPPVR